VAALLLELHDFVYAVMFALAKAQSAGYVDDVRFMGKPFKNEW
jgi:hypothetical protein